MDPFEPLWIGYHLITGVLWYSLRFDPSQRLEAGILFQYIFSDPRFVKLLHKRKFNFYPFFFTDKKKLIKKILILISDNKKKKNGLSLSL